MDWLIAVAVVVAAAAVRGMVSARAEAKRAGGKLEAAEAELGEIQQKWAEAREEAATYKVKAESLEEAAAKIESQAKGIAAEVMKANGEDILKRFAEQLEGQNKLQASEAKRQKEAIGGLVGPVKENLKKVEQQISEMEQKRQVAYEGLGSQVDRLMKETGDLNMILHSGQGRGYWAEEKLLNILELAGMTEHVDFEKQESVGENSGRPDVVVTVPNGAKVAIDAKFPLVTEVAQDGDRPRDEVQREYADRLGRHLTALGRKNYAEAVDGPLDFTVMFVPSTPILDEAMAHSPGLWEDAWREHRVLIATPGLLITFLRTVAVSWQQHEFAQNTENVLKDARDLYDRLCVYAGHVDKVGVNLKQAMEAHNRGVGSLNRMLFPAARRFKDYGVDTPKELPSVGDVGIMPTSLNVPEAIDAEAASEGDGQGITGGENR